mgnify:FL=1
MGERDLEVIVAKVTGKILEPKAHTLDYAEFCNRLADRLSPHYHGYSA